MKIRHLIHLLMNFVSSSSSFRTGESWTPVCLPRFNDRGFLHAHVCYVAKDVCLVLLSTQAVRVLFVSPKKSLFMFSAIAGCILSISRVQKQNCDAAQCTRRAVNRATCRRAADVFRRRHRRSRPFAFYLQS